METLAEWLESLKGADGALGKDGVNGCDRVDGKDGMTPDMSEYPKTTTVEKLIETQIAPILESGHNHKNKDVLDAITARYTAEEQQKLADFSANYLHFISTDNDYQIHFSMEDFGWNDVVYVVCTKELNLSENLRISMCYKSGATENGDLYLVPKSEHNDVTISVYVYTQI